jgi:hypothetical protein
MVGDIQNLQIVYQSGQCLLLSNAGRSHKDSSSGGAFCDHPGELVGTLVVFCTLLVSTLQGRSAHKFSALSRPVESAVAVRRWTPAAFCECC